MHLRIKQIIIHPVFTVLLCLLQATGYAQNISSSLAPYTLIVNYKDTVIKALPLKTSFSAMQSVYDYINDLPVFMASKGYPVASVDSVWKLANSVHIILYTGTKYK